MDHYKYVHKEASSQSIKTATLISLTVYYKLLCLNGLQHLLSTTSLLKINSNQIDWYIVYSFKSFCKLFLCMVHSIFRFPNLSIDMLILKDKTVLRSCASYNTVYYSLVQCNSAISKFFTSFIYKECKEK